MKFPLAIPTTSKEFLIGKELCYNENHQLFHFLHSASSETKTSVTFSEVTRDKVILNNVIEGHKLLTGSPIVDYYSGVSLRN